MFDVIDAFLWVFNRNIVTLGREDEESSTLDAITYLLDHQPPQLPKLSESLPHTPLPFLYFERKTLMELKFEDFLKIWESKPRKLSF